MPTLPSLRRHLNALAAPIRRQPILPPSAEFLDPSMLPARLLVVAPHPDDEWIGAAGLLHSAVNRGSAASAVILTDGAAFVSAKRRWDRHSPVPFAEARSAESVRFLTDLGVPPGQVHLLNLPDGRLASLLRTTGSGASDPFWDAVTTLAGHINAFAPEWIVIPSPYDWHRDHWSGYVLASAAIWASTRHRPLRIMSYLTHWGEWPAPLGHHPRFQLVPPGDLAGDPGWLAWPLTPAAREFKRRALKLYATQVQLPSERLYLLAFVKANELFQTTDVAGFRRERIHVTRAGRMLRIEQSGPAGPLYGQLWQIDPTHARRVHWADGSRVHLLPLRAEEPNPSYFFWSLIDGEGALTATSAGGRQPDCP